MEAITELNILPGSTTRHEDESFWRKHYQAHQDSGLTRKEYCRINLVNYDRFGYWLSKLSKQKAQMVAVKIKPPHDNLPLSALCTLHLRTGHEIIINDMRALSLILEKLS